MNNNYKNHILNYQSNRHKKVARKCYGQRQDPINGSDRNWKTWVKGTVKGKYFRHIQKLGVDKEGK